MDEEVERRRRNLAEVITSAISIFVAGMLVWPPLERLNYWPTYPEWYHFGPIVIAEDETIAIAAVLSLVLGGIIATVTNNKIFNIVAGGIVSYITAMWAIETIYQPSDSPVHFLVYGVTAILIITGGAFVTVVRRKRLLQWVSGKLSTNTDS